MTYEFVYGVQPVLQVLLAKRRKSLSFFFHRSQLNPDLKKIFHLVEKEGIPIEEVTKEKLSHIAQSVQHQGVVLKAEPYSYTSFEHLIDNIKKKSGEGFLLILDQIQDPQNLGAILRTAQCSGVDGVILPERGSALATPTVSKVSAGAAEWVPVCLVKNLARTMDELKEIPFWLYGSEAGEHPPYWEKDYRGNVALVMGSEGSGLRNLVRNKCDFLISIPLLGTIPALNVSVAAGILLFEVLRQRKNSKSP